MVNMNEYEDRVKGAINNLEDNFNGIRAGRANPKVLDKISVNYYGSDTPLNQVANIQVPEARMITIQPWEANMLKEIEKAINMSDLGINPQSDGKLIRLVFPQLTEERRKDLVKEIKKLGEEAKVAVRNIRRDAIDHFRKQQKSNEISEDELFSIEQDVQVLTDKYVENIDEAIDKKEKELLEI